MLKATRTSKGAIGRVPALIARGMPPLLRTEDAEDFHELHRALRMEVEPRGIIEDYYVADLAYIIWETVRLRRCKATIINTAYLDAVHEIIGELSAATAESTVERAMDVDKAFLKGSDWLRKELREQDRKDELARRWCGGEDEAKQEVAQLLGTAGLDESTIEARAISNASKDLEWIEKSLISLENRRYKFLRQLEGYRESFAQPMREGANIIIDAEAEDISLVGPQSPEKSES